MYLETQGTELEMERGENFLIMKGEIALSWLGEWRKS